MILLHQFPHDGELEDGLFELVDAGFGGEEDVEVGGDALPGLVELTAVTGGGQGVEERLHQGGVGAHAVLLLLLKPITQRHQFIDFRDNPVLLGLRS